MNKNIFIFTIVTLLFLISSCTHDKKMSTSSVTDESEYININPSDAQIVNLSSFVKDIKYWIPDSSIIVGNISKFEIHKERYYIFDNKTQRLCIFDKNGTFVQQIGKLGNGPGEYIRFQDFTVSEDNSLIYILNSSPNEILIYDFNGRFLKNVPIDIMGKELYVYDDYFWIFTNGSDFYTKRKDKDYNLFKLNQEGIIISRHLKYDKRFDSHSPFNAILNNNKYADFHYSINNNLYKLDSVISLSAVIDFGRNNLPYEIITSKNAVEYLNADQFARVANAVTGNECTYLNYVFKNRTYGFIKYKDNPPINYSFLNNDIDDVSFALSMPFDIVNNKILYIKDIDQIFYNNKKEYLQLKNMNDSIVTITKESNPVIAILTMHDKF